MNILFRVDGFPKAQPRAKARVFAGHAAVYDPGTAKGWKELVREAALPFRPETPLEGPVLVTIVWFLPRPQSLCRKRDPEGPVLCWKRPDRDNLDKAVLDVLTNMGMFRDDAQVCRGEPAKYYHSKAGRPGTVVEIRQLSGDEPPPLPETL